MRTRYITIIAIIAIVGLIVFKLAANKRKLNEKNNPAPVAAVRIPVKVVAVVEQVVEINILKTGNLAPFKEAKALAMSAGTLLKVNFELGDNVKQGQVLALTDTRLAQLELQKAETNAAKLKNDLNVYTELLAGKAATQEKVNGIRQDYENALNQVQQAKKNIADAAILAPTAGVIAAKKVEQGMFVNAGTEVASIINLSRAKVQVNLTEAEVYKVKEGQAVKITTDVYPGKTFNGTISFISPQADETHSYLVELLIGNDEATLLRSGTFVYVDFSRKTEQQVLVIPREALTQSVKDAVVYVLQDSIVHQRAIQTGADVNGMVQVLGGLKPGEQVVTAGQINLKDGSAVSVSK